MNKLIKEFKTHWLGFITPILLCLVSLNQIYLYTYDYLNRWKGGGFGMFSTIQKRFLHIHLIKRGALECAYPHPELQRKFTSVQNHPNYLKLEQLTKLLSKKTWVYSYIGNSRRPNSVRMIGSKESLKAEDRLASFDSVELQIFDVVFHKETFTLEPVLLRKIQFKK